MNYLLTAMLASVGILAALFVGHVITTNDVIKIQEKQIARLRTENFRLKAALNKKDEIRTIEIHDHRISEDNIPDFNKNW